MSITTLPGWDASPSQGSRPAFHQPSLTIRWEPFTLVGGEMRLDLSVLPENKTLNPTGPQTHSLTD